MSTFFYLLYFFGASDTSLPTFATGGSSIDRVGHISCVLLADGVMSVWAKENLNTTQ